MKSNSLARVGPWVEVEGGAYRALLAMEGNLAENCVAIIEKTPRVRIRALQLNAAEDWLNWAEGPFEGDGPCDPRSRQWCDNMLRQLGYALDNDKPANASTLGADTAAPAVVFSIPTHAQARIIKDALDLYVRMGMGQLEEIEHLARFDATPFGPQRYAKDRLESLNELSDLLRQAKYSLGYAHGGHWAISAPEVPLSAKRAYALMKVLAKALAEARNLNPSFRGVDYDGVTLRYTDDPLAHAYAKPGA